MALDKRPGFLCANRLITATEFGFAGLLTIFVIILNVQLCLNGGPLWRDEIAGLHVANASTLTESWHLLAFENQPFLHYLVLRAWCFLGLGGTDLGLRFLCLASGLFLIAAIWISSWLFNKSPPLLPLVFFALNRQTLRVEALRPYGLMLVWLVLAFAFIWQLTFQQEPKRGTFLLAAVAAVLSVQTGFLSIPLLGAIGLGSIVVLSMRRTSRSVALVLSVGAISALSFLPYLPMIIQAHNWNRLQAVGPSIKDMAETFYWISTDNKPAVWGVFLAFVIGLLMIVVIPRLRRTLLDSTARLSDHILFSVVVSLAAVVGTLVFLWLVGFPIARRYYPPMIGVLALSAGLIAAQLRKSSVARIVVLVGSILIACAIAGSSFAESKIKYTDCDQAASEVAKTAEIGDMIVVTRFDFGISFQRYYRGAVEWDAIPPISDHQIFRWDLVKQAMTETNPIQKMLDRIEFALQSGHRVFIVGQLGPRPNQRPSPMPPAPSTPDGWNMYPYVANWRNQIAYLISHHALTARKLPLPNDERVDPVEKLNVLVVSGWR